MHILFANTGVQIVCVPLRGGRFTTAQIGYGWQHCRCEDPAQDDEDRDEDEELKPLVFAFLQWQLIQSNVSKLYLAIDTTLGDPDLGYAVDPTTLTGDFPINVDRLLDRAGQPMKGIPKIEMCLRAATATAGEAKPVHMIVDFGNSRTGALLLEMSGEVSQSAEMMPFELLNRYSLDGWDDEGEPVSRPSSRWFSSRTIWCNSPYLSPATVTKTEFVHETVKGKLWGKKQVAQAREFQIRPDLFDDLSM
ncbi:MAG: hypothetical protein N2C14_05160, partial [Planctomycetales bacterium]